MNISLWSWLTELSAAMPSIEAPERPLSFKDKASWSFAIAILLLAMKNIPLVGFAGVEGHSIFYFVSCSVGSMSYGIFELGCVPLITSHTILQLLIGFRKVSLDLADKQQRAIFNAFRKTLSILISLIMATVLLISGHFGGSISPGAASFWLILLQLLFSQIIFVLWDECIAKGFGMSSGINILITACATETVFLSAISPRTISFRGGSEYEGAILLPFQQIFTRVDRLNAVWDCFTRFCGPNLLNVVGAVVAVAFVIWFQSYYFELSVTSSRMRGWTGIYPIRILDNYSLPIYFLISTTSNLYFWSYCIWKLLGGSMITLFTGTWAEFCNGQLRPTFGLAYLLAPGTPRLDLTFSVLPNIVYTIAVVYATVVISKSLGEVLGNSPRDVSRQLKEQQLTIRGFRDSSLIQVLDRYIPPAASAGGLILGVIVALADILGAAGSGCGLVIASMAIHAQVEAVMREQDRNLT